MTQMVERDSLELLDRELDSHDLKGFWRFGMEDSILSPSTSVRPHLWRWTTLYESLLRAGDVVSLEQSERRVIALINPGMEQRRFTTHTIQLTAQLVKPGERARAHRHSIAAFRFVVKGGGAYTTVNGQQCVMETGDLILTPHLTWHDHTNLSEEPIIWLDGLDSPLIQSLQQLVLFPYQAEQQEIVAHSNEVAAAYRQDHSSAARTPYLHYRWADWYGKLRTLPVAGFQPDGDGYVLPYANQATGGPTLSSMQCALHLLTPGLVTRAHRHTSTSVYHVVRGAGTTVVGDLHLDWEQGDSFVVPLWYPHHHVNRSANGEVVLFSLSDAPLLQALDLYRQEDV